MPHAVIWELQRERLRSCYSLQKGDAVSLLPGVYASLGKDAKGERASLQCLSLYPGLESSVLCRSSFGSKIENWKGVGLMVKDSFPS